MDFRELSYIIAVADHHSVTEAAKKLYISQPSLSYIISKVEEDLGVKLFDRKTNPISLTYAGERYVKTAREIMLLKDNLRRELADIGHGQKGRINIGIPTERAGYMLPKVIGPFRAQFPNIEIHLQESKSEEIITNLMNDKIAFCVLPGGTDHLPVGVNLYGAPVSRRRKGYDYGGDARFPGWSDGTRCLKHPRGSSGGRPYEASRASVHHHEAWSVHPTEGR